MRRWGVNHKGSSLPASAAMHIMLAAKRAMFVVTYGGGVALVGA